jgi:IclR family transcriptional regulator, KDG regulon repressor
VSGAVKQLRRWQAGNSGDSRPPVKTRRGAAQTNGSGPLKADVGAGYMYRALIALEQLASASYTADELAETLRVHRRTATRLLDVLTLTGFVQAERLDPQRFSLTTKIVSVAGAMMLRLDIVKVGFPYVTSLRDRTNEASHLALPAQGMAVQVIQETSSHRLTVKPRVGEQCPVHASAIGKALAAHLPGELEAAVRLGLPRLTDRTITSRQALEKELAVVRERGYAIDDQEMDIGTCCVAAPVRNGFGEVVASLGVSGPSVRLTQRELTRVASIVVEEANSLSRALGHRDSTHAGASLVVHARDSSRHTSPS